MRLCDRSIRDDLFGSAPGVARDVDRTRYIETTTGLDARLAAPPFYLPISTLIAGAVTLGLYFRLLLLGVPGNFFLNSTPYYYFRYSVVSGRYFHVLVGSFIGFWVAEFVSGYLLWQAVWSEGDHRSSPRIAGQRLRGLLLLICFAWAFFYLVTYFAALSTPLGISDPH
jgi:hypothetical protein